ncbi:MAG TPA: LPS export ABC transporter periplasmic protein LptC [Vicinamibacteria bacterium]|nr:LPS export ABC transporter periplasmic protein LptC [Vicinamibacteria bacterium]
MTPRSARTLRQGLLALVLLLGLSVAWTWRWRPRPTLGHPVPQATPSLGAPRTEGLVLTRFTGEKKSFELQAREKVGQEQEDQQLKGVALSFSFVSQGQPSTGHIVADACTYSPSHQKAVFTGNVVLTTADGFEFRSPSLVYRGDKGLAKSEAPVAFKRKDLSGEAVGMTYAAEDGRAELLSQVKVRIQDEGNPPTDIVSGSADLSEAEKTLRFQTAVVVTQGSNLLKADRLKLNFGEDRVLYRATAQEAVDLTMSGTALPNANLGPASGTRHLLCRKLDLWFRPDKTLATMTAGPDADLTVFPGPQDPPERRRVRAKFIEFRFDELGQLAAVQSSKDTVLESFPLRGKLAKTPSQTVTCERMLAEIIPGTSEPRLVEFQEKVIFVQGKKKATTELAAYTAGPATLELFTRPELWDGEQGTHLKAQNIVIGTRTNDVTAKEEVQSILERKNGRGGLLAGKEEPAVITARFLDYVSNTRTGLYREGALLRSGKDEIRAHAIRLQETPKGRRLEGRGEVLGLLNPKAAEGSDPVAKLETRAAEMDYDEGSGRILYRGAVSIRQGDIATKSPAATLLLTDDGAGVASLRAGEPVEVQQGSRKATGAFATYTPSDQTMLLVGDRVTLKDPGQEIQGRSLLFHVGDERVTVDGREAVRTETIFRKEPPKF